MSTEIQRAVAPTPEEKKKLLEGWLVVVQDEIDVINRAKDIKLKKYFALKSNYDKWLANRMKWINTLESRANGRKAQLKEIQDELKKLEVTS